MPRAANGNRPAKRWTPEFTSYVRRVLGESSTLGEAAERVTRETGEPLATSAIQTHFVSIGEPAGKMLRRRVSDGAQAAVGAIAHTPTVAANVNATNEVMGRVGRRTLHFGQATPGRHRAAHCTDIHFGSSHTDCYALIDFFGLARFRKCSVILVSGDVLDGTKQQLLMEQRAVGWERQSDEAVDIFKQAKLPVIAIDGNHDRYAHESAGVESGRMLADKMQKAGVEWHYAGSCYARALVHGARVELYHPHGGGSSRAAVKRTLAAKARMYTPEDRPNIILGGHFHKFSAETVYFEGEAMGEGILCVGGGTFQKRDGDFGVRMIHPWDVGGAFVSWTIREDGKCVEPSVEFARVREEARGWAA